MTRMGTMGKDSPVEITELPMTRANGLDEHRGSALLEAALALLVLIPLVLGIFDLGRAVYVHSVVAAAAQEGARYGLVHRGDTNGITTAAQTQAAGLDVNAISISVAYPDSGRIEVTVNYVFNAITPLIANVVGNGGQIVLSSTARMWN
jgi:Flp pilus assembly protein TadG